MYTKTKPFLFKYFTLKYCLLFLYLTECDQAPIYLCEGSLQNCCELRAPSPEKAAFYLDSALLGRCSEQSHLFYTLHVYQYSVAGKGGGLTFLINDLIKANNFYIKYHIL